MDDALWSMITAAGTIEKGILVLLAVLSVALWSMVFLKAPEIFAAKRNGAKFMAAFRKAKNFGELQKMEFPEDCVQAMVFNAAIAALNGKRPVRHLSAMHPDEFELNPEASTEEIVQLSMQHTAAAYIAHLHRGLSAMAVIGSTTPFIGLFGTVVGIMTTFHDLGGVKTPSMQVVAPGISGALVATAAGLGVAIPAVVAYSWFASQIGFVQEAVDILIEKIMSLVRANVQQDDHGHPAKLAVENKPVKRVEAPAPKTLVSEHPATPLKPRTVPKSDPELLSAELSDSDKAMLQPAAMAKPRAATPLIAAKRVIK
jgi:biopolymer transport protein TolQ